MVVYMDLLGFIVRANFYIRDIGKCKARKEKPEQNQPSRLPSVNKPNLALPQPQITYLFKDLHTDIILGNPKKASSLGSR